MINVLSFPIVVCGLKKREISSMLDYPYPSHMLTANILKR